MRRTTQITEPKVMPSMRICRDAGTRPNSSVLAQPSAVVTILPAKRDPIANRAARNAIRASMRGAALGRRDTEAAPPCDPVTMPSARMPG